MTKALIAAEADVARAIINNLTGLFNGLEFDVSENTSDLFQRNADDYDVIILSRFFSGENPLAVLDRVTLLFSVGNVILLAGPENEQQRNYIRYARGKGLSNIVTGRLPGNRPVTVFAALGAVLDRATVDLLGPDDSDEEDPSDDANYLRGDQGDASREEPGSLESPFTKPSERPDELARLRNQVDELQRIITELSSGKPAEESSFVRVSTRKGVIVMAASNKGGVGKTTVACAISSALAKAGVPVALVDYDLGSPNVTAMLGVPASKGIEALAGRPVRGDIIRDLIVRKDGLDILPGITNKTLPAFQKGQLAEIVRTMGEAYPVVVVDTPPEFWTKPWLGDLFRMADYVLAVTDQSIVSEQDTVSYAPAFLSMGVTPEKIGIVVNRFSPKLHNIKVIEKKFCSGFKKGVKQLPSIVAVILEDWNTYVSKGYKGDAPGIDDAHSQWHRLAEKIAVMAGYGYRTKEAKNHRPGLFKKKTK